MNHLHQLLLTSLLCLLGCALHAQTGTLSGTISDAETTLPGASIYLQDKPSTGTVSDFDGTFTLSLPVGEQTLQVSYTGYATETVTVNIEQGKVTKYDIELASAAIMGEVVVVSAQALGQAKAINQQLNSDAIANFVSADKIKELPDVNAAEAISRLPGVAINRSGGEGSKIVVRGLDPKFTSISINGVRLPSTSGNDRSIDLSLISPELLSGIELFKSPTANMDGDALGGSVNLTVIKAPEEPKGSVKVLGGYNGIANSFRDYKGTASYSRRFFDNKLGVTATGNIERFNRSGERIGLGWADDRGTLLDTTLNVFAQEGARLDYSDITEIRKRQNGSLGLDFEVGQKSDVTLLGIYSRTSRDQYTQDERFNINQNRIENNGEIRESQIQLFSGSISTRHRLGFGTIEWGTAYSKVNGDTPRQFELQFRNFGPGTIDPEVTRNRDRPEEFYLFANPQTEAGFLQQAQSAVSGNSEAITSGFLDFDVPFQISSDINATFEVGGKAVRTQKDRFVDERVGRLLYLRPNTTFDGLVDNPQGAILQDETGVRYYSINNFTLDEPIEFTRDNGEEIEFLENIDPDKVRRFQELFGESVLRNTRYGAADNYDLEETVYAGYAQLKVKLGSKLTLIPGFRYEYSDNVYNGNFSVLSGDFGEEGRIEPRTTEVNYGIPLPHLHTKYKPLEWLDFRASYSTTLARPDYNYVVPNTLINLNGDPEIRQGNPNLDPSVSRNLDFFVTAFSGKWGLISAGVFHKQIENVFYPLTVGLNNDSLVNAFGLGDENINLALAPLETFSNSPDAFVRGFEVELQTNLNFLPAPFNGFVANFNYTRLQSETTINVFRTTPEFDPITFQINQIVTPFERQVNLLGQARDILNASLGYDYKRSFSARISASYQGDKISGFSAQANKDRFNQGFWRFDAAFKKKFESGFNIFLNLNNIGNQEDINFFTSLDRDAQTSRNFITSVTRYGPTATFGVEYKW